MNICISAENKIVSFSVIKALLQVLKYNPCKQYELVSSRILFPENDAIIEAQQRSSLTEAARYEEQIRFPLMDRILRSFRNISSAILQHGDLLHIKVTNAELLDEGSNAFLKVLSEKSKDIEIQLFFGQPKEVLSIRYDPSPREQKIEQLAVIETIKIDDYEFFVKEAQCYINCGDAWTAERILKRLVENHANRQIHSMLGLTYGILGKTIEAEFYYKKWRASDTPVDLIHANYVLSMLYTRHHPTQLLSISKATEYLEESYKILQNSTEDDIPNIIFERVFNRNGYALILVRTGRIDEAIAFLKQGIVELSDQQKRIYLHKTVLIYNLAQCYKLAGNLPDAITTYEYLLELDSNFPEYHMELARCHADMDNYFLAISALEKSRDLDPSIAEIYSLLGFCYQEMGDLEQSTKNYSIAYSCEPKKADICYDYAFALAEQGLYKKSGIILEEIDLHNIPSHLLEDIFSLRAEAVFNEGNLCQALEILYQGLQTFPTSPKLNENIALLESNNAV